jgi:hypothetical protein
MVGMTKVYPVQMVPAWSSGGLEDSRPQEGQLLPDKRLKKFLCLCVFVLFINEFSTAHYGCRKYRSFGLALNRVYASEPQYSLNPKLYVSVIEL